MSDARDAQFYLQTLGTAALSVAGEGEPRLLAGKGLALLTLLALTPGRRLSRDVLIDMLWSDVDLDRARNALRQALWSLRRTLGTEAITGSSELVLAVPLSIDRDAFLAHVETGALDEAVASYAGPFLPAFCVPGGATFEQWADVERRRLETVFIRSSELLVGRMIGSGRTREALAVARTARELAPDNEAARRLTLETAVTLSNVMVALVEAESLTTWATAFDQPLEPSTQRALAAARVIETAAHAQTDGPTEARTLVAELIGREPEFAQVVQAWERVRNGSGMSVRIEAHAGLGKSRLINDVGVYLRRRGALVIIVRGAPADRHVPFAFAGDLAAAIASRRGASGIAPGSAATLVALNPTLSSRYPVTPDATTGEGVLARRVHAMCDLIKAIADERPLALCIDDWHWVDSRSRQLLESIVARLRESRVLVCIASRPDSGTPVDTSLVLVLRPLRPTEIQDLVTSIGQLPDAPWSTRLLQVLTSSTGGSPLLTLEALRLAVDRGVLTLEDGAWRCADENALPTWLTAGEVLRERIRPLAHNVIDVLGILALYGAPVSSAQLHRALGALESNAEVAQLPATLRELERLGLVMSGVEEWLISHDEIGRIVLETLDAPHIARLSGALAGAMLVDGNIDALDERRAVRLLLTSRDDGALHREFRNFVERRRHSGDRRAHHALAREWLGEEASGSLVTELVTKLPRHWRAGLWSARRQAAAIAVLAVALLGSSYEWRSRGERRRTMPQLMFVDTSGQAWSTIIDSRAWPDNATPLKVVRQQLPEPEAAIVMSERQPVFSPDGRSVAWNVISADSTTIDIWIRTPTGTRRLTNRARDDVAIEWLPDGSGLLGLSNQWSPPDIGNYDVAVFDTATGTATPLTQGVDHEGLPRASPDGQRIAFKRETRGGNAELCVTHRYAPPDGTPACRYVHGVGAAYVLGWVSTSDVLVVLDSGINRPLVRVDWDRNVVTTLLGGFVVHAALSADRRWISAQMSTARVAGLREWVIPVAAPDQARQVIAPRPLAREAWWQGPMDTAQVVRRLVFVDTLRTIAVGVRYSTRVHALAGNGSAVPLHVPLHWWVSDTSVAVIDSAGGLRGLRHGTVTIEARLFRVPQTLGGSVSAALSNDIVARQVVRVDAVPVRAVFSEHWDANWRARWIAFGSPAPDVVTSAEGLRALANNGDGVHPSFALQREANTGEGGIGVEMRQSTPITRNNWQIARMVLVSVSDTAALSQADPNGSPAQYNGSDLGCGAEYPAPATDRRTQKIAVRGGIATWVDLGAIGDTLASGAWWTLRLQLLPDGRCGIAVNGRVVWVSPEPIDVRLPRRLRLGDESAATRILHGPLRMWRGVPPDVDWSR
jgi:DNA-binding SARP family transcriptional activator